MHIKSKKALERNQSETRKRLAIERTCAYEADFMNRPMLGTRADVVRSSLDRPLSRGDEKNHFRVVSCVDGQTVDVVPTSVGKDLWRMRKTTHQVIDCRPMWKIRHHG
jgi:hypothetical protein